MKNAIVVGASSGIGKALAILLSKSGYKVAITGRREKLLQEIVSSNPENIIYSSFDITDSVNLEENLNKLINRLGSLDLLVHCSGVGFLNDTFNFEQEKKTIDVNVVGFTQVADFALKYFTKQKYGHFCAISSLAGIRGSRKCPSYNASKAYQINFLEGLEQQVIKSKLPISVTDIRPGFVDTELVKGDGIFWLASTTEAAKQIFDVIRSKKSYAYVTKRWSIIAFILQIAPRWIYKKIF